MKKRYKVLMILFYAAFFGTLTTTSLSFKDWQFWALGLIFCVNDVLSFHAGVDYE